MGLISRVSSRTYRYFLCSQQKNSQKMVQRITYRRRLAWNTSSNQRKISKTPGGKLVFLYTGKRGVVAKCGDTGKKLQGVKANRAAQLQPGRTTRRSKTVTRAYGGCVSANALKRRITRAFLIEEQKIVVKVMKAQQEAAQKAAKEAELVKAKRSPRNPRSK